MTTTKTPGEWALTPKKDLGVALAEELASKPWEHDLSHSFRDGQDVWWCIKCKNEWRGERGSCTPSCPTPNPINFKDWNIAKYWQGQGFEGDFERSMKRVWEATKESARIPFGRWFKYHALPEHYLMAAALSQKRVKDRGENTKLKRKCPRDATRCVM